MAHLRRTTVHLLLTVFWLAAALLAAPHAWAQQMASVSGKEANVRSGPGTRHAIEWTLSQGYPLKILKRQGQWVQVEDFENDRGWIHQSLIGRTRHHVVKVPVANLRGGPNTRSRVVAKLSYGDVLRTLERREGWVRVRGDGGAQGWVAQSLVWGW